jgi:hypothetical protein
MKKLFVYLFLISGIILFFSCSEESNPTSSSNERYFSLYFDVDSYDGNTDIDVFFWTSDVSEVPTVTINGVNIDRFWPYGGILQGRIRNLQYSNTINYSVSISGKTTSGSINVPSDPYNVLCNGTQLDEENTNYVSSSNSYNFSWNCNNYDYFNVSWETNNDWDEEITTNTNITFYPDGSDYYYFGLRSYTGTLLTSGVQPNVTGDYGKGYVFAELDYQDYSLSISNATIQKLPAENDDNELKIENYRNKFIELMSIK